MSVKTKHFLKVALYSPIFIFLLLIFIVSGFLVWYRHFSPVAGLYDFADRYEKAMRKDIYGGKTPEETLKMLSIALEKEDIKSASKYFSLETSMRDPNYFLTRKKWEEVLKKSKEAGKFGEIINLLPRMVRENKNSSYGYENNVSFVIKNENGEIEAEADLWLNPYSNVWKIQSL